MCRRLWLAFALAVLVLATGCGQIPASPLAQGSSTSPGPAYLPPPGAEGGYPTPPPPTSGPIVPQTDIPRTEEPTPAPPPPFPTPLPVPVLTPIPVASPPYIPSLAGPASPFQVFFTEAGTFWVLDSRDGQVRQAPWPADNVSPDGRRIFLQQENALWVQEVATGSTWKVFAVEEARIDYGAAIYMPSWSPDGEWLAFLYYPDGLYGSAEGLIAKADGSGETIRLPETPAYFPVAGIGWSPDGSRVLYVTMDSDWEACMGPAHCDNLWVATADGSSHSQLLPKIFGVTTSLPQWSPDGAWIVFAGVFHFERENPSYSIWLIRSDGTGLTRLTDPYPTHDLAAVWTPDGGRIVFQREGQGLWLLDLADGSLRQLYAEAVDSFTVK